MSEPIESDGGTNEHLLRVPGLDSGAQITVEPPAVRILAWPGTVQRSGGAQGDAPQIPAIEQFPRWSLEVTVVRVDPIGARRCHRIYVRFRRTCVDGIVDHKGGVGCWSQEDGEGKESDA
jgi:hypothetical protein